MVRSDTIQPPSAASTPAETRPESNFNFFLAGLLLLLFMLPAVNSLSSGHTAFTLLLVFLSGTLVLASWTFRVRPRLFFTGLVVSGVAFLLSMTALITGS